MLLRRMRTSPATSPSLGPLNPTQMRKRGVRSRVRARRGGEYLVEERKMGWANVRERARERGRDRLVCSVLLQ